MKKIIYKIIIIFLLIVSFIAVYDLVELSGECEELLKEGGTGDYLVIGNILNTEPRPTKGVIPTPVGGRRNINDFINSS